MRARIGLDLELEDADGVGPLEQLEGRRIVEGDVVDVGTCPRRLLDQLQGAFDYREVAETQEIHLEQSQGLHRPHLVLGDYLGVLALLLDRYRVGERLGRDNHGGGVDRVLPPQALQPQGRIYHIPGGRISLIEVAQLLAVGVPVLDHGVGLFGRRAQHLGQRGLLAQDGGRHQPWRSCHRARRGGPIPGRRRGSPAFP